MEIEELKGRLGEPGSSSGSSDIVTTAVPNSTMDFSEPALDPESTSTPALTSTSTSTSTSTLYTLIAHLTSSLRTQTAHLSTLQTELKGLVWEDTLAHRASGSGSRTGTQAGGDRGRLWRTGPGPGASTSTSTSVGLKARGAQRDSRRPSGVGDDMDTAEDEEQLDLDLELEKEEKEMLNGPEQTELEKALLDLRGYAEVAAHLWDEVSLVVQPINRKPRHRMLMRHGRTGRTRRTAYPTRQTISTRSTPSLRSLMFPKGSTDLDEAESR